MVENSLLQNSPSQNSKVSTTVLLFVFGKSFANICLKIYLSNIIYTNIVELYAVCFGIRDNTRYSKASYISARNKSWLYCGLSHV